MLIGVTALEATELDHVTRLPFMRSVVDDGYLLDECKRTNTSWECCLPLWLRGGIFCTEKIKCLVTASLHGGWRVPSYDAWGLVSQASCALRMNGLSARSARCRSSKRDQLRVHGTSDSGVMFKLSRLLRNNRFLTRLPFPGTSFPSYDCRYG